MIDKIVSALKNAKQALDASVNSSNPAQLSAQVSRNEVIRLLEQIEDPSFSDTDTEIAKATKLIESALGLKRVNVQRGISAANPTSEYAWYLGITDKFGQGVAFTVDEHGRIIQLGSK